MKIKLNKLLGLILTVALLLTVATLLTACGGEKISEIYVTKSDLPRVDYVEGQELDLSKGKLTVVTKEGETKLPLTAPEITVTGYDKDLVGDQMLTVTYMELTTSFTVNVAKRTVAENYETKYFVGGEFNPLKGKIKITTDDAKSFYVNMNDPTVSLVSFDSSVAGDTTVTVLYNNGVNSYYCQFDVTVYEQSNVEFFAPTNTEYMSHYEGKPDAYGGYFKVTSSDSTLTMNVPVTENMISGFDPSAATIANKNAPLEQTLTVNYLGKEYTYKVYITFSSVSAVNYYAGSEILGSIDWERAKEEGLTDEEQEEALAAITEYYALTEEEKALISDEAKAIIGRPGAIAMTSVFYTELGTYQDSFKLGSDGNVYFIRSSYEKTAADTARLNDPDEKINVYASTLRKIIAEFGELSLTDTLKVKDIVIVYSEELEAAFKAVLNHLVDVFTLVKDIPEEWDAESLKPYGDNLLDAVMQINMAGYYKNGHSAYYTNILSPWRENDDLFEMIYTYFLYDYDNKEFMTNYMWGSMPMPGLLEDWYTGLNACVQYSTIYKNYASQKIYLVDVSPYMYTYFRTMEIAEEIKNSKNQFWIDIYNVYNGDNMNTIYMYAYSYGYLYYTNAMIDSEAYHELWAKYYDVLKLYNDETLSSETHKAEITLMFDAFEALTPSELMGFLSSISFMYTSGAGQYPMLGHSEATSEDEQDLVYNVFSYILSNNYSSYLTDTNKVLFNDLLSAMESYVLIGYKDGALEEFNTKMGALAGKIGQLAGADKTNFEDYFSVSYYKYYSMYEITSGKDTVEITDTEKSLVDEYVATLRQYFVVYGNIYQIIQSGYTVNDDVYPILYGLYAKASEIRATLTAQGNAATSLYMYTVEHEFGNLKYTLEKAYYVADSVTTSLLTSMSAIITQDNGALRYTTYWEIYKNEAVEGFLAKYAYLLYSAYFEDGKEVGQSDLNAAMDDMRKFTNYETSIIVLLNIDDTVYKSMSTYYKTVLTENGLAVSDKLITAAKAYTTYSLGANDENLAAFASAMENLKADYDALSDEDKAYLSGMYSYYSGLLDSLMNNSDAEA